MTRTMRRLFVVMVLLGASACLHGQEPPQAEGSPFGKAADDMGEQFKQSLAEMSALSEQIEAEQLPLARRLNELEGELSAIRKEYEEVLSVRDNRGLSLTNLTENVKGSREEAAYLGSLFGEYIRNFKSRLHIAEMQHYGELVDKALSATEAESPNVTQEEVDRTYLALLSKSLDRLNEILGGSRFDGTAVDSGGLVVPGTFVLLGPAAVFRSEDGQSVGTIEQRVNSLEPSITAFADPDDAQAASDLVSTGKGSFPLDPTLGNAHRIESTHETLLEHVSKGGPVMVPILVLAGASLLVILYKWLSLIRLKAPSERRIDELLAAVARHDKETAGQKAALIGGPVGRMLGAGVDHLGEPRELVEEVMYETVLSTRLKLQRLLPFIAISAAAAPLLGLLGTVTGIINTFKLIKVFGAGDVKMLSGGISEALITTEFGLIVAIPSLLLHAFLSRKARGIVNQMEKAAVALINQISRTPFKNGSDGTDQEPGSSLRGDLEEGLDNQSPPPSLRSGPEPEMA